MTAVWDCPTCLANVRSPRCKRGDCAHVAEQLRLVRTVAADMRRQFEQGHGTYEAIAYLTRAVAAEARADELGTRVALAERALRLLAAGKPAKREVGAWRECVKSMDREREAS